MAEHEFNEIDIANKAGDATFSNKPFVELDNKMYQSKPIVETEVVKETGTLKEKTETPYKKRYCHYEPTGIR